MTLRTYLQDRADPEYFSAHAGSFNENSIRIIACNLQFEFLTFMNMKITVFWDVLRCGFVRKLPTFRINRMPLSLQFSTMQFAL
jgi:hypothetical protein